MSYSILDVPVDADLDRVEQLAKSLDAKFRLPGTSIRFGWDTIVGLVPGIGDTATLLPSLWMIWRGYRRGIRKRAIAKMTYNSTLDYVIGAIPIVGDLFDVGFKANLRNASIFRDEVQTIGQRKTIDG